MKWFDENLREQLDNKEKQMKGRHDDSRNCRKGKDESFFIKEILHTVKAEQEFNDGKIRCTSTGDLFETSEFSDSNQPLINYFTVHGYIDSVHYEKLEKTIYLSCPNQHCKKKVFERDGKYRCDNCQDVYPRCKAKYMTTIKISDGSERILVQFYDE